MLTAPEHALAYCELREIFNPGEARTWLETPNGSLGDRQPMQCSFEEVMRVIDSLKSGAFA